MQTTIPLQVTEEISFEVDPWLSPEVWVETQTNKPLVDPRGLGLEPPPFGQKEIHFLERTKVPAVRAKLKVVAEMGFSKLDRDSCIQLVKIQVDLFDKASQQNLVRIEMNGTVDLPIFYEGLTQDVRSLRALIFPTSTFDLHSDSDSDPDQVESSPCKIKTNLPLSTQVEIQVLPAKFRAKDVQDMIQIQVKPLGHPLCTQTPIPSQTSSVSLLPNPDLVSDLDGKEEILDRKIHAILQVYCNPESTVEIDREGKAIVKLQGSVEELLQQLELQGVVFSHTLEVLTTPLSSENRHPVSNN